MAYPCTSEIDFTSSAVFSTAYQKDQKTRVDVSMKNGNKLVFNLCSDVFEPFATPYSLDKVQLDGDATRRGQAIFLADEEVLKKLQEFDELILDTAVKNQKEWFSDQKRATTPLTREVIAARYRPMVNKFVPANGQDTGSEDKYFLKFKVKVGSAVVPTQLHLINGDDLLEKKGTVEHLCMRGCKLAPILSSFGLWFMGGGSTFGLSLQAEQIAVLPGVAPAPCGAFASKRSFSAVAYSAAESEEPEAKSVKVVLEEEGAAM